MATALCKALIRSGQAPAAKIVASDPDPERRRLFERETGARTSAVNTEACRAATVILAVKPQVMPAVLKEVGPLFTPDKLVITIAAGIPAAQIEAAAPGPVRVIRAMPNTPILVGQGAVAIAKGRHATAADAARARTLFESAASVIEVEEELIHAVTALSGSGPAYVFYLAEIMTRAGVEMGLSEPDAARLAQKTILGAGHMLAETGEPASELRRKVTSPGGTTEAALRSMEQSGVADRIVEAMKAACRRSQELGSGKTK
jgi:pyrroline-5-carboxylate reductase